VGATASEIVNVIVTATVIATAIATGATGEDDALATEATTTETGEGTGEARWPLRRTTPQTYNSPPLSPRASQGAR
jgi:hypothetical protein